VQACGENEANP